MHPRALRPTDFTTLAVAKACLTGERPMGDAELTERLQAVHPRATDIRASLARLEAAGQLGFGASGWWVCEPAPPLILAPYGW